jgi:hypothetical protein
MQAILLALAVQAGALSNFPRNAGGPITRSAIGVALSGSPAVVVAAGELVVAYRSDGSSPPGFPFSLGGGEASAGAPAAADMDGDGRPEVAVVTLSGKLFLWGDGRVLPGFPVKLGAKARAGPSFADVDGDGRREVLAGDDAGRLHAFAKGGKEAKGWPASLGAAVTSSAASARFAGGTSVAAGCQDGRVHVLDGAGRERSGFPLRTEFEVTGAPAFADLDDDGSMDLVVASQDFKLYAVDERGKPLAGFPVAAGYRLYEGPAIADLDGDGKLDVVFASADGLVHAVTGSGAKLPGWPVSAGPRFFGGPSIGDVDRDGRQEVVVAASDGQVVALSPDGKVLAGFPARLEAQDLAATPLLFDLAQDGSLSIFVGNAAGQLHALRAQRSGGSPAVAAWPGPAHDAARSGRYGPNPARYRELALAPAEPRTGDRLVAAWRYTSLDATPGEPEPPSHVEWLRDGKPVPELKGRREVPPRTARKGEKWSFALTTPAGTSRSLEVKVRDTPPGPPEVALDPPRPARDAPVKLVVQRPSADDDGDPIRYQVEWLLDGLPTGVTGTVFPAERLRKGVLLTARVTATDGEAEAEPVAADAFVRNTAPGPLSVALAPPAPRRADAIQARIARPAADVDGDPLSYRFRWKVNGEPRNLPLASDTLPPGVARKHQTVEVEARAFDGQLEGPFSRAEVEVANTPPGAPQAEVLPHAPRRGDLLRAALTAEAPDADLDPVTYRYAWTRNGKPLPPGGDPREVPGHEVKRGDRFEVEVWATDGEADGPRVKATAVAANTPPTSPRVAIEPERPHGGEPLRLVVLKQSEDADGDEVRYQITWTRDGRAIGGDRGPETLPPTEFRKHETVQVTVTPSDGASLGEPGRAEVVVANAPPGAPEVALSPARPTVLAPLRVEIAKPARDADGDPLTYRYRWLRDGLAVPVPDASPDSRREPYWTSVADVAGSALRKGQRWSVEVQAHDGEAHGPVARAEAVVANSPPPPPKVAILPDGPRRGDGLRAMVTQEPDPDEDAVTYRYAWKRNGARVDLPPEQSELPRGLARKGERWQVEVTASDGEAESAPVRAETAIANSPPGPVAIALCDAPVPVQTQLEVRIRSASTDPDGDAVVYRYAWSVNGKPVGTAKDHARLSGAPPRKHDRVRVAVTPWDGQGAGPESAAECLVENTPPTAPEIAIEPREPTALTGLAAVVRKNASDRDGDAVSYRYQWFRDGVPAGVETAAVAKGVPRHGETWRVVVTPFDGEASGERATAQATVKNTPPPAPSVAVRPEGPTVGLALSCQARVPEKDADQERIEVHYRWLRDGQPVALAEDRMEIPAGVVRRGERWKCEAWSSDGFELSAWAASEVVVRNSPPSAPVVVIEPERPTREDGLTCRIATESVDPDGDKVTYAFSWWRGETEVNAGAEPSRIPPERLQKGQRWRCAATPVDGTLQGPPGRAERAVGNTPPGPARVRILPRVPRAGERMRCEIAARSEDPDGDAIRYRYAWLRNGEPQPFAESSEEVPTRLVKEGDRWRCLVTPNDGEENGPTTGSPETVVAPGGAQEPGSPAVSPPKPRAGSR